MIPATRAVGPARTSAEPLPWNADLRHLYEAGVTFRKGQLIMVAGFPGAMKSAFTTWLCNLWNLPTLYVSADMSAHTTVTRLGSLRSGYSHEEVSKALADDGPEGEYIESSLADSRMQFLFDDSPGLGDIEEELLAWTELYDALPDILVVDNLVDLEHEGEDEYRSWRETLLWLKGICRDFGITIIVLHHARELAKSDYPAARRDLQGKVSQTPELTLSVSLTPEGIFRVSVVKNRTGGQDAMARSGIEFAAIPATMSFRPVGRWTKEDAA